MLVDQATVKIPAQRWYRVIPVIILVYLFSYLDRINIGFAMAGGMNEELGMTASIAGMAAGIFFIGYLFLQAPGGHIAERWSAKKFIGATMIIWGGLATATGYVTDTNQLLGMRFILGVAEGGVWPATLVLISRWFPSEERGRANACAVVSIALASILAGPLSGWIISEWGWRNLFIFEGGLSLLLLVIWFPLMDDGPETAKWISTAEKEYLLQRRKEENASVKPASGVSASYLEIIKDVNLWKMIIFYFTYLIGMYGLTMWLPTLIKSLMKTGILNVGLLSAIPFIACAIGAYVFAAISDRSQNRRLWIAIPPLCFALCLFLSTLFKEQVWVAYGFLVGCGFFMQGASGAFWALPRVLFPSEVAGGAIGIINALGNVGGFMGPSMAGWFITTSGSNDFGIYSLACSLLIAAFVALTLPAKAAGVVVDAAADICSSKV